MEDQSKRELVARLCNYDFQCDGVPEQDSALNYRSFPGLPVHAVGQGTEEGIRRVLRRLGASQEDPSGRTVHWACMREEPVVYIGAKPYTVRDVATPFENVTFTGISSERVEAMEEQFKRDIEEESRRFGGKILVHEEAANGVHPHWLTIFEDATEVGAEQKSRVRTLREVYEGLKNNEGFRVHYCRIPVSAQEAPLPGGFDAFVDVFREAEDHSEFVFNCQSGRGRSTVGVVVGALLYFYLYTRDDSLEHGTFLSPALAPQYSPERSRAPPRVSTPDLRLSADALPSVAIEQADPDSDEARFERGEYPSILDLVRLLDGGNRSKFIADQLIDRAAALINIRTAVSDSRQRTVEAHPSLPRLTPLSQSLRQAKPGMSMPRIEKNRLDSAYRFERCLSRYFNIVVFADYVRASMAFSLEGDVPHESFASWLARRPEIMRIPETFNTELTIKPHPDSEDPCTRVVLQRSGSVLCRGTLLKSDHFPGCHMEHMKPKIEGAPNYRKVEGFPVNGVGQPTVDGIRSVLNILQRGGSGGDPTADHYGCDGPPSVLWLNMREEPVLYINSRPFVLRNMDKPFNNVEYTGISIDRIEQLERRLKDDVLKEASQHNSKILLHDETPAGVETVWEDIRPDTVLTINEVYEKLSHEEGYDVQYFRVPITDEKVPELQDFDEIVARVKDKDSANVQLVFNCQVCAYLSLFCNIADLPRWGEAERPPL